MDQLAETMQVLSELQDEIRKAKENGILSPEQIIEIGLKYKSLDTKAKRLFGWQDLNNLLDRPYVTGEAFRCRVKAEEKKLKELSYSNDNIKEDVNEENSVEKQMIDLYKERTKTRDSFNSYRRLIREEARIDSFKESIIEAIRQMKPLPSINTPVIPESGSEAILMLADMHIGVKCNNFYNKYNSEIAYKRLSKAITDTMEYCKQNNVTKLNVINMGDMIHGIIHTDARLEQEFDIIQQITTAAEYITQALNKLLELPVEIHYYSVLDNHSRVMANKSEHIEKESLSKLIDWYIKARLENSRIIFEKNELDDGLGMLTLSNNKKVVFAHGHEDNINSSFSNFVGATKQFIDYALLAHYHSEKMKAFQGFKVIVSGSMVGTEQYALSRRLFGVPSQTLLIWDNLNNLHNISIDLSDIQE